MWFFCYFNFERNSDVLNSRSSCILLNKTLIKTKQSQKWKIPGTVTLCFSSSKNRKLKVKLWWPGAREKKESIFVPFILSERNFFNICVLSRCIVYWIHFQNRHTFTHEKTLLHTVLLLVFKSSKAFSVSLMLYL